MNRCMKSVVFLGILSILLGINQLPSFSAELEQDVVTWYKKLVSENYGVMPGGVYPDVVKNPGIPVVPNMKVPVLILNGSNEYVVDMEDQLQMFKELGTPDKSIIIQRGGFHLMFLEKRGHVGQQESIFFWMTKK